MQNDFTPMIEPTPKLKTLRCRIAAWTIAIVLKSGSILAALLTWYLFDLYFAVAALLVAYLVLGIVRAKIRNMVIPLKQQEYPYTDLAIATWYVARIMLCETTFHEKPH